MDNLKTAMECESTSMAGTHVPINEMDVKSTQNRIETNVPIYNSYTELSDSDEFIDVINSKTNKRKKRSKEVDNKLIFKIIQDKKCLLLKHIILMLNQCVAKL